MKLPRPLAASIDQVARAAVGKDWSLYATILDRWAEIVGPTYAKDTAPVKITFPKGKKTDDSWASKRRGSGGQLTVRLPQGLVMDFTFQTEIVRQRINTLFGYEAISKIGLMPYYGNKEETPKTRPSRPILTADEKTLLEECVEGIEDEGLKQTLARLGESILAQGKVR